MFLQMRKDIYVKGRENMSELLNLVRHTLEEKLAENIVTIDIRNVNAYTDYYVICTAKKPRHANSLVEFVEKEVTKNGFDVRLREGERESTWVLIDINEVVVHIFTEDARNTYRLEALWADQPQETL